MTSAAADYLKAVYRLREGVGQVTTQRLAAEIGVSSPSATNMIKRLHGQGLLRHVRYQGVELTDAGEQVALRIVRRHRLLELYLAERLGFPWDEAHAEAERLAHGVSAALEARLDAALGHPTRDPHGDPIPSAAGTVGVLPGVRLLDLEVGARSTVVRVSDRDPAHLRYLGGLGLSPGTEVTLLERLPFDGPVTIRVGATEQILGLPLAAAVHVAEVAPTGPPRRVGGLVGTEADEP